jgi:hypothetical protein
MTSARHSRCTCAVLLNVQSPWMAKSMNLMAMMQVSLLCSERASGRVCTTPGLAT